MTNTHNGGEEGLLFTWFPLLFPRLGFRVQEKINAFADKVMWEDHPTTIHSNLRRHMDNPAATCPILVLLSRGYACPASRSTVSGWVKTLEAAVSDTPLIYKWKAYIVRITHLKGSWGFYLLCCARTTWLRGHTHDCARGRS